MVTLTDAALELVAANMEANFPECDFKGHTFHGGPCLENTDSGKGFVYYSGFEKCQGSWVLLPGYNLLPTWFLAVTYLLWLLWLFFGVAVVSDVFVEAIEVITSSTKMVKRMTASGKEVEVEVPVWNWVVSNITLMACGSSSPEILLAIVEVVITLGKDTEELGPSTIVGSGSFNLFVITAICTISLKNGEFKKIEHTKVFLWTTTWMMWAHLWLWLVYKKISPGQVELWEALVTLGMMPIFVYTSYLVDTRGWNWFSPRNEVWPDEEENGDASVKGTLTEEKRHSILYYRNLAVQQIKGNMMHPEEHHTNAIEHAHGSAPVHDPDLAPQVDFTSETASDKSVQKVMFKSPQYNCLESSGAAKVQIMRIHGDLTLPLVVHYMTEDSSAVDGLDYEGTEGSVNFAAGEDVKEVSIRIVDDDMSEPDVNFFVVITGAENPKNGDPVLILQKKVVVTIVDDDDGGILTFLLPSVEAGMCADSTEITVLRRNGADGKVTVNYTTKEGSGLSGVHFVTTTGTLVFNAREIQKSIIVPLLPQGELDPMASLVKFDHKAFKVVLSDPTGGAQLGSRPECRIILVPGSKQGEDPNGFKLSQNAKPSRDGGEEGELDFWAQYRCQFKDAIMPEFEDGDDASTFLTCLLHYINITWKIVAALIPPKDYKNGYASFIVSLALLAGMMAIVKEAGGMFGCSVGLSEIMTGISIVAVGTSLPDTFASRMAAINDDTADAAIGNVMASNSVNVFLGLGIPWTIATIFWAIKGDPYLVSGGSLGFSLIIFFVAAFAAIGLLYFRRSQGGELGGSKNGKWSCFSFLVGLWLIFLLLAGLYDYGNIPPTSAF